MEIVIKGVTYTPKYTFNSFKYMEDLNFADLQNIEKNPFKLIPFLETLVLGAVNSNPNNVVSKEDVEEFLNEYIETSPINEIIEELINLLQDSNFFKSLQKKPTKKIKK